MPAEPNTLALAFRRSFLALSFFAGGCLVLSQPLEQRGHDQRQANSGIDKHFAELAALRGRNELAPGNRLAVRTAGEASPVHGFGADAQTVVVALERHVLAQPPMT